jgi:glyoxylase-like metal-dependent hydrolase (beta-lactamase superfamily II)
MRLIVQAFAGGPIDALCYLVADQQAGEALVIDAPGDIASAVLDRARELGVRIIAIVATHGHFDHILDLAELKARTSATVSVHRADAGMLERPSTAPFPLPIEIPAVVPDRLLAEGDAVTVGGMRFSVLSTPGHTPGSICLLSDDGATLFTGDTLFAGGWGRTDLPGGSVEQLERSLARLGALPADTRVYPGHGSSTAIGRESWLPTLGLEPE